MEDYSQTNNKLHRHYTTTAMKHLKVLKSCRVKLIDDYIRELVKNNAAYRDAAAFLYSGTPAPDDNNGAK